MNCPRTGDELKEVEIDGIKVDISESCGGVWFDNYELKKFDEVHESAGEKLIELIKEKNRADIDLTKKLKCPRDVDIPLKRRFYSPKRQIQIDECPQCGGIWLDAGELTRIREMFPTEADRKKAGREFANEIFKGSGLADQVNESRERKEKAHQFAKLFRWLCPTSYIPGKQEWGSF